MKGLAVPRSPDALAVPAIEQRRTRAVDTLTSHFACGDLALEELEARLDRAELAATPAELDALVADLSAATEPLTPSAGVWFCSCAPQGLASAAMGNKPAPGLAG